MKRFYILLLSYSLKKMHSFWLLLFVIKLYSHINIFKVIKKKYGKDIYTLVRSFEKIKTKYMKTILDIKFLKQCKQEQLNPTFANVRLSTKGSNFKLKHRIARIIIEDELQYKHRYKKKLKNEVKNLSLQLKLSLSTILYNALLHKINLAIKSRSIAINHKHKKKILNLQHKQQKCYNSNISYTSKKQNTIFLPMYYHKENMMLCHMV